LSYLFTNPFVNWTRSSSTVVGSVMFFFDYTMDVSALRTEAERLVRESNLWDGQVFKVQVVDTTEVSMKVRLLASAADAGKSSDLGAYVREGLIAFVRKNYPTALPRTRQEPVVIASPNPQA
jgi:hypothetical protein